MKEIFFNLHSEVKEIFNKKYRLFDKMFHEAIIILKEASIYIQIVAIQKRSYMPLCSIFRQ